MSTRSFAIVVMMALTCCKRESPCRGYNDCPMDVPLSMGAAPCCCGEVFVDEAALSRVGVTTVERDTGGCWVQSIHCSSDDVVMESVVCAD